MINWHFIEELEGAVVTAGYVPRDGDGNVLGNSGVTIASGVDLGQRSVGALWGMGLDPSLTACLCAYATLTGEAAARALNALPLQLEDDQARAIDQVLREGFEDTVQDRWDRAAQTQPESVRWDDLTDRQQTVVMSVAWQYGTPWRRCPTFWRHATAGRWGDVIRELRDFGDAYPTRRGKEADYLEGE